MSLEGPGGFLTSASVTFQSLMIAITLRKEHACIQQVGESLHFTALERNSASALTRRREIITRAHICMVPGSITLA